MHETSTGPDAVTMINVFTFERENQQQVVEMLASALENVMSKQPGFLSARVHRGLDGTRAAVYAQWRSREDFAALATNPDAAAWTAPCSTGGAECAASRWSTAPY